MSPSQESSLHRKVFNLLDEYYMYNSVQGPSVVVREIEQDSQKSALLYSALRCQVARIRRRSQAFADGEVTVFDKVLLNLFDNRDACGTTGLFELFVNEYIDIDLSGSVDENSKAISTYLEAQKALNNSGTTDAVSHTANHGMAGMQLIQGSGISSYDIVKRDNNTDVNKEMQKNDVALQNMIDVYQVAKAEYYINEANKQGDMLTSVRFLRDSAENILRHLHSGEIMDQSLVSELQKVYHASVEHATRLAGGRKRTFDHSSPRPSHNHGHSHNNNHKRRKTRLIDSYRPGPSS